MPLLTTSVGAYIVSGGSSPTFTKTAQMPTFSYGFISPITFSGVNTGAGTVVITFQYQGGVNSQASGVTLNGSAMTLAAQASIVSGRGAEIWYITGQSANASSTVQITGTLAGVYNLAALQASVLTGASTFDTAATQSYASPADPHTVGPITIPTSGFGILSMYVDSGGPTATVASGGLTIDYQTASPSTDIQGLLAHTSTSGSVTAGINVGNFTGAAMAFAPVGTP